MLVHPISTNNSAFFSLFFCRETTKKYFHNFKWGSSPKDPSHSVMNATMC
jgi:hypothetical protein